MKSVYESSNSIDANIILGLLEQAGLDARIEGEYLQGGVGELQAVGIMRVVVSDDDYETARGIVADWDARQPPETPRQPVTLNYSLISGVGGVIIGVLLTVFYYNTPVTTDGIDYNGDGRLDEVWTYKNGLISKIEVDRNFDGQVDYIDRFDHKGLIESSFLDEDFDGRFETESGYLSGSVASTVSDTTGDGFKDYRMEFSHGVLKSIVFLNPETGNPLKIESYGLLRMESSDVDSDGDGVLDTRYRYNQFEEVVEKMKIDR